MKKVFAAIALVVLLCAGSAHAQPQAKEIAFSRPCPEGVPVYSKTSDKVACGALAQSGTGYVIEMASAATVAPSCPKGFDYIGNLDKDSLAQRGLKDDGSMNYFACVKE